MLNNNVSLPLVFMAEKGVECLKEHRDSIQACVKQRVPDLQQTVDDPNSLSLDSVVINEEQCGLVDISHLLNYCSHV